MRVLVLLLATTAGCSFEHGALSTPPDTTPADWWNTSWHVRMPLTIVNSSTTTLPTGYQIGFANSFLANPCAGSFDDVRIVYKVTTELDRAFDNVSPMPWAWFPLASPLAPGATSTGEYVVYCGNASAPPAPGTPSKVFDLYDDFAQPTIDANVWTVNNTVAINNGTLVCGNGSAVDNGVITKTAVFSANHAVDFVATTPQISGAQFYGGFETGIADQPPWVIWWTYSSSIIGPALHLSPTAEDYLGATRTLDTQPHYFGVENYGTNAMWRYDDVPHDRHAYDTTPPAMFKVRLWNYNSTPTVAYDMVRVRQAVDPAPTVTTGAAEQLP